MVNYNHWSRPHYFLPQSQWNDFKCGGYLPCRGFQVASFPVGSLPAAQKKNVRGFSKRLEEVIVCAPGLTFLCPPFSSKIEMFAYLLINIPLISFCVHNKKAKQGWQKIRRIKWFHNKTRKIRLNNNNLSKNETCLQKTERKLAIRLNLITISNLTVCPVFTRSGPHASLVSG